jgi:hypothetical protein
MQDLHRDQSPHRSRSLTRTLANGRGRSGGSSEIPVSANQRWLGPGLVLCSRLPPEPCEVLVLVAVERLADAAIATVLGVPSKPYWEG